MVVNSAMTTNILSYEVGFLEAVIVSLLVHVALGQVVLRLLASHLSLLLGKLCFTHLGLLVLHNLVARPGRWTSGPKHLWEVD